MCLVPVPWPTPLHQVLYTLKQLVVDANAYIEVVRAGQGVNRQLLKKVALYITRYDSLGFLTSRSNFQDIRHLRDDPPGGAGRLPLGRLGSS